MRYEHARAEWDDGARRLRRADPAQRERLERITARVVEELRRRLGGPFTTDELAELYGRGTDWCLDLAMETIPADPAAWDGQTVADVAFGRYAREALDYAGGRRVFEDA